MITPKGSMGTGILRGNMSGILQIGIGRKFVYVKTCGEVFFSKKNETCLCDNPSQSDRSIGEERAGSTARFKLSRK